MHVENKHNCTGCGACYNICSQNAISMQGDKYGFYKPIIDNSKCVHCGLCENRCPLDNYKSTNDQPRVYYLQNSDNIRFISSSGGAFSVFADYILEIKGVVYGVIWDKDIKATHFRATTADDVNKMHGSKYVQSNTKDTYKQAKNDLEKGLNVLYTGTPCQIAGLKSYLRKDYKNLLTIDLVCHGSQSPLFLEKYKKDFLKDKNDEQIININLRSKLNGWGGYFTTTTTTKGIYNIPKDYYTDAMDLTLNECCFNCQFTGVPRIADITIGDFWGIEEYNRDLNDKKGTSIILLNNIKSASLFETLKSKYKTQEITLQNVTKRNPNILRPSKRPPKQNEFMNEILKNDINTKTLCKKYLKRPFYIVIYRLLPQFAKDFIKYKILKMEK